MKDEEAAALLRTKRNHPSSSSGGSLPPRHPLNLLYRCAVIGGSLWFLHHMEVFVTIMRGANVNHMWFKSGLAASIGMLFIYGLYMVYFYICFC